MVGSPGEVQPGRTALAMGSPATMRPGCVVPPAPVEADALLHREGPPLSRANGISGTGHVATPMPETVWLCNPSQGSRGNRR